jgi:hypothetical protein
MERPPQSNYGLTIDAGFGPEDLGVPRNIAHHARNAAISRRNVSMRTIEEDPLDGVGCWRR